MSKKFKKGQWLIRKWSVNKGGETDFVKFQGEGDEGEFEHSPLLRFKGKKLEHRSITPSSSPYIDSRMSLQFRVATKSEIDKYIKPIIFNKKQVEFRYSGKLSKTFWNIVNSLNGADWQEMYSLGCVLQNVEHDVLRALNKINEKYVRKIK